MTDMEQVKAVGNLQNNRMDLNLYLLLLWYHYAAMHQPSLHLKKKLPCPHCKKLVLNVNRHVKTVHQKQQISVSPVVLTVQIPQGSPACYICPDLHCSKMFSSYITMSNHLKTHHIDSLHPWHEEHLQFKTISEFYRWKFRVENVTYQRYPKDNTYNTNGVTTHIFICHRSCATFKPSNHEINKSDKVFCPAAIFIQIYKTGTIAAIYIGKHFGHESEIRNGYLTYGERLYLAQLLEHSTNYDEIIAHVQKQFDHFDKTRLYYVTKDDIDIVSKDIFLRERSANNPAGMLTEIITSTTEEPKCILQPIVPDGSGFKESLQRAFDAFRKKTLACTKNNAVHTVTENQEELTIFVVIDPNNEVGNIFQEENEIQLVTELFTPGCIIDTSSSWRNTSARNNVLKGHVLVKQNVVQTKASTSEVCVPVPLVETPTTSDSFIEMNSVSLQVNAETCNTQNGDENLNLQLSESVDCIKKGISETNMPLKREHINEKNSNVFHDHNYIKLDTSTY